MANSNYLADRLREVLTDGKWVAGTNFKEQILGTDWRDATLSIDGLNTIAQITFHIHYYIEGVTKVLEGGPLDIRDKFSFDSPPIRSEEEWNVLTAVFCEDCEQYIALVEELTTEGLGASFADEKYGSYQRNIDLMIEHAYYHLGQIVMIKKLIKKRRTDRSRD